VVCEKPAETDYSCMGIKYGNWTTRRYANSRTGQLADVAGSSYSFK